MPARSSKSLSPGENEHLRAVLRKVVDDYRDPTAKDPDRGKELRASKVLGISRPMIIETLNGGRGGGMALLSALSRHTGQSIDELLGRAPRVERDPQELRDADELATHPDFARARAELVQRAERRGETLSAEALREVGTFSMSRLPPRISVDFLRRLYEAVLQAREDNRPD